MALGTGAREVLVLRQSLAMIGSGVRAPVRRIGCRRADCELRAGAAREQG